MSIKHFLLSLIIPIVFFSVGIATVNDYGETTDEKFDQHIGEYYYYQWGEKGLEGLRERFIPLQRNYGPFFDIIAVASNDILHKKLGIIKNPVASYHFPVLIVSTISIYIVFLFAFLNWGLVPGLLSSLTLALLPRFIGDSQNNLKDTPLMTFLSLTLLLFFLAAKKNKLYLYFFAGIFWGLTYAIKINALIIAPIIILWYMVSTGARFHRYKKFVIGLIISVCSAFITILIAWPYYRYDTLTRFIETYNTFKNHEWNEYILYLGAHYRGHDVPWHYPIIMFGVTLPIIYIVFLLLGCFYFIYSLRKKSKNTSSMLVFLFLWILLLPLTQILSGAPMYDGIRHFLTVLPPLCLIIGFTIWKLGSALYKKKGRNLKIFFCLYILVVAVGFSSLFIKNINLHPYQIVYFNELTGGVRGAKGNFDLDYWGQSLKEAAEWINTNLPTGSTIWLTIPMAHHFPIDRSRFHLVNRFPDYKVNLIRGMLKIWDTEEDYLHPKRKPIHTIYVDGGSILQIFEYPENKEKKDLIQPLPVSNVHYQNGILETEYLDVDFKISNKTTVSDLPSFDCRNNEYNNKTLSLFYSGFISIPKEDKYCFKITSDDDSILKLNKAIILKNSSMDTGIRKIYLKSGYYLFELQYINNIGPACLDIQWSIDKCYTFTPIPKEIFFYTKEMLPFK